MLFGLEIIIISSVIFYGFCLSHVTEAGGSVINFKIKSTPENFISLHKQFVPGTWILSLAIGAIISFIINKLVKGIFGDFLFEVFG